MSMGNFIGWDGVPTTVMAISNSSPGESARDDTPEDTGAGMAHTTVVPTNFDPDEHDFDGE